MQITCPCCFARYALDVAAQDDAARELNALLAKLDKDVSIPLVIYIGLFRSRARAVDRWPALRQFLDNLPQRPDQLKLPEPPLSAEERKANRERARQIIQELGKAIKVPR